MVVDKRSLRNLSQYDVQISASLYTSYYFELRTLCEKAEREFTLKPLTEQQVAVPITSHDDAPGCHMPSQAQSVNCCAAFGFADSFRSENAGLAVTEELAISRSHSFLSEIMIV